MVTVWTWPMVGRLGLAGEQSWRPDGIWILCSISIRAQMGPGRVGVGEEEGAVRRIELGDHGVV